MKRNWEDNVIPLGRMDRVIACDSGDRGSIPGWVISKTQKVVLVASLHYKVRIKGKVEQSREKRSALLNTSV